MGILKYVSGHTDPHTYRHKDCNTLHPSWGQSKNAETSNVILSHNVSQALCNLIRYTLCEWHSQYILFAGQFTKYCKSERQNQAVSHCLAWRVL